MTTPRSLALLLALSGCFYVDDGRFAREVEDADGDGGIGTRFDGPDCVDDDPSVANCDADGDGYLTVEVGGDDCNDTDASVVPGTLWFPDGDGDGYGVPEDSTTGCGDPPEGWSTSDLDCDDQDATINPNARELCDALDRNCDGDPIAAADDGNVQVWADADGDTYGDDSAKAKTVCSGATGVALRQGDCDDDRADVSPDAAEVPYDGVDQDCDAGNEWDADLDGEAAIAFGGSDCDDANADVSEGGTEVCDGLDNDCDGLIDAEDDGLPNDNLVLFFADLDGDGFGSSSSLACPGSPPTGFVLASGDCDDVAEEVHPGAVEWCNGRDDDCNNAVDDGTAIDAFTAYFDDDHDGYGSQGVTRCDLSPFDYDKDGTPDTFVLRGADCVDTDPNVYPGALEVCGDLVRQDCSAFDADDCDNDGYRAKASTNADCDDDPSFGGAEVNPGQKEICDGLDNDCDGLFDSADPDVSPASYPDWYFDFDGDGHGEDFLAATSTCDPPGLAAPNKDDCDDFNEYAYPGAIESCDGNDNDCDGYTDEYAVDALVQYEDQDRDGFGSMFAEDRCPGDPDFSPVPGDCDDFERTVHPTAIEVCDDTVDNNCNGLADAEDPTAAAETVWYPDGDRDGVGLSPGVFSCGDPSTPSDPYVAIGGDCNDADKKQRGATIWFGDVDNDGYSGSETIIFGCKPPGSWRQASNLDCDDSNASINPGQKVDGCDLRDDDCNGTFDDNPEQSDPQAKPVHDDLDLDGWGDDAIARYACYDVPAGSFSMGGDCKDTDPDTSPDATEVCGDGYDNDCNPSTSELCPCIGWQWPDNDGDGFGSALADPVFSCEAQVAYAPAPDDCDDGDMGTQGKQYDVGPGEAANLVAYVQPFGCAVIRLAEGTYPTNTLVPGAGSSIHIHSKDPTHPATLVSTGGRVIDLANTGSDLTITNVNVSGNVNSDLVHVAFDRLALVNTTVDGQNAARGIVADGGRLDLRNVTVKGAKYQSGPTQLDGSAVFVSESAEVNVSGLDVLDSTGASSIFIEPRANATRVLDDVHLYRSAGVEIRGTTTGNAEVNHLESWDSLTTTLLADMPGELKVNYAVIARSVGNGIEAVGTSKLRVDGATILECLGTGVWSNGSDNAVFNSYVNYCNKSYRYNGDLTHSVGGTASEEGYVTNVMNEITGTVQFVSWVYGFDGSHPGLPGRELWDLHLRDESAGKGVPHVVEDVGGYSNLDPYYGKKPDDGIPDGWATTWFGSSIVSLSGDPDGDGLTNADEYARGTCPIVKDTDQDGTNDNTDRALYYGAPP